MHAANVRFRTRRCGSLTEGLALGGVGAPGVDARKRRRAGGRVAVAIGIGTASALCNYHGGRESRSSESFAAVDCCYWFNKCVVEA